MEALIAIVGTVATLALGVVIYIAGVRNGKRQERERREHEIEMENDRRLRDFASKAADEYVKKVRTRGGGGFSGPNALAGLGLDLLRSDARIRDAVQEMYARSGYDPWEGLGSHLDGVDLVEFFRHVPPPRGVSIHECRVAAASSVATGGPTTPTPKSAAEWAPARTAP